MDASTERTCWRSSFCLSAAKLSHDVGESIEDVSRFLDHGSLAVTTTYLRRLEGQEDRSWAKVAETIGATSGTIP